MQQEYLLTNKRGSYCSADYLLGNTRKYHGLLVVSDANLQRKVILSRLEEKLNFDGDKEEYLNTNLYQGNIAAPDGAKNIINKQLSNSIILEYLIGEINVLKQIQMLQNANQVLISYKINSPYLTNLKITPFLTNRSFHQLSQYETSPFGTDSVDSEQVILNISDTEKLQIDSTKFRYFEKNIVYKNFYYPVEERRGYDCLEDLVYKGTLVFDIYPQSETTVNLLFSYIDINETKEENSFASFKNYIPRLETVEQTNNDKLSKFNNFINRGANDFLVQTSKRTSIIAGYHWFEDWGRDTFISFRGLVLLNKHFDKAKKILVDWSSYIKDGLVPNRPGLNEYNSLDATLWYVMSLYNYYITTQDGETLFKLLPIVKSIIKQFKSGTHFGIQIDENGFLSSTDNSKALTWMDAVYNNKPFTPRIKSAVEIQMLWFNVLNIYRELTKHTKELFYDEQITEDYINTLIQKLQINFNNFFWNDELQYVYDFIDENNKNAQIRPNAVLGLHLPYQILAQDKALKILEKIDQNLLTPIGLKTLNSEDLEYCSEYTGDQYQRDKAYHNGTVWPWIYGFYLKSYLIVNNHSEEAQNYVKERLITMMEFIEERKLNYLPEIFSAENLEPNGCLSQAWNYAAFMEVIDMVNINKFKSN